MKDFRDIQEGILGNIDDTINSTDARLDPLLKERAREYFNNYKRRSKGLLYFFDKATPIKLENCLELVDKACSWDSDVLVVDFNVFKDPEKYRLYIVCGPDLPMIKVIDHKKRHTVLTTKSFQYPSLQIVGNDVKSVIDVSKIIHPDTVISTLQYGTDYSIDKNTFIDNKFPGKVIDGTTYKCKFNKIYPNEWPNGTLKFHKDVMQHIFLETIGMVGKHLDSDMYTGFMIINN